MKSVRSRIQFGLLACFTTYTHSSRFFDGTIHHQRTGLPPASTRGAPQAPTTDRAPRGPSIGARTHVHIPNPTPFCLSPLLELARLHSADGLAEAVDVGLDGVGREEREAPGGGGEVVPVLVSARPADVHRQLAQRGVRRAVVVRDVAVLFFWVRGCGGGLWVRAVRPCGTAVRYSLSTEKRWDIPRWRRCLGTDCPRSRTCWARSARRCCRAGSRCRR